MLNTSAYQRHLFVIRESNSLFISIWDSWCILKKLNEKRREDKLKKEQDIFHEKMFSTFWSENGGGEATVWVSLKSFSFQTGEKVTTRQILYLSSNSILIFSFYLCLDS